MLLSAEVFPHFAGMYMAIALSKDLASTMVHNIFFIEYRGRGVVTSSRGSGAPTPTGTALFPSYSVGFPTYKLSVQLETVTLLSIRRY